MYKQQDLTHSSATAVTIACGQGDPFAAFLLGSAVSKRPSLSVAGELEGANDNMPLVGAKRVAPAAASLHWAGIKTVDDSNNELLVSDFDPGSLPDVLLRGLTATEERLAQSAITLETVFPYLVDDALSAAGTSGQTTDTATELPDDCVEFLRFDRDHTTLETSDAPVKGFFLWVDVADLADFTRHDSLAAARGILVQRDRRPVTIIDGEVVKKGVDLSFNDAQDAHCSRSATPRRPAVGQRG